MHVVKVRRVGNSNVVTLPKSLELAGFAAGAGGKFRFVVPLAHERVGDSR